jgi:hypothetical protein
VDDASKEPDAPSPAVATSNGGPPDEMLRAQERVQQLEEEVAAKDELVTALTVQLEQLAEQLDRLQRSGADRKRGGGGLPADVVEGHKKIVGDLERIVQQWEDMQAGLMLGRIEVQLSELRDFIVERLAGGGPAPALGGPASGNAFPSLPSSIVLERVTVTSTPAEPPAIEHAAAATPPADAPAGGLPSMWESLKSQMLQETPTISAEDVTTDDAPVGEEPPPPSPISPSMATHEELEAAIDARDGYIAYLLRKIRRLTPVPTPPDWLSLERVPEELCRQLETHAKQLEEHLRLAEIELSMERARIGREQAQLRQQQESIEKQMRRLGLKTIDEQAEPPAEVAPADRRWVRFLGLPKAK